MKQPIKYTRALVIVHGKSELCICRHIKSNLRLKMEIDSDKKGEKSIQITDLITRLNNKIYISQSNFIKKYDDIESEGKGKKKKLINFNIFIIMDVDDCTPKQREDYINKNMFKGHWAYDYIIPIWNIENLEDVMKKCDIEVINKGEYKIIFPINRNEKDIVQIQGLSDKLAKCKETNMEEFLKYCLE